MNLKKKVAFHTLGCKLNFSETSTIARSFPEEGFEKVEAGEKADIYIINTCSVTDAADKKCRQTIKKFIKQSPDAFIAVVGCYAQLKPEEISSIPGVDLVLGINEKFDIPSYISSFEKKKQAEIHSCELTGNDRFIPSHSAGDRTRSFLKIQDGCDYGCSYCTIPLARGASRNPEIELIVNEAREIASGGIKEIVLTGVNTGDFGKSTGNSFHDLLKKLLEVEGIERYRISSIEPNLISDELIYMAATHQKIVPHFHIPLQSGCNKILALMSRRYRREVFSERVNKIIQSIPLAGIGADIITGFPGETDADAEETYSFLENLPLSYLHVFPYSSRPGTRASGFADKVSSAEKDKRSKRLISLSAKLHSEFLEKNTGSEAEVLFEKEKIDGLITGYTGNYIRVEYPWKDGLAGEIRRVRLNGTDPGGRMNIDIIK